MRSFQEALFFFNGCLKHQDTEPSLTLTARPTVLRRFQMQGTFEFSAPLDAKAVHNVLSAGLEGAVSLYGQAWSLSVRDFWPACSQHEQFIADIESCAGRQVENPFAQPAPLAVMRTYNVEVAKVQNFDVVGDVTSWLDNIERVCSSAEFAEAAWIDLACTSMEMIPKGCWAASEQLVLESAARDHVRPWDRFKDWCKSNLSQTGLARYQLRVREQTSSVAAYKADFDKLVENADVPAEEAVTCWVSGLQADL